MNDLRTILGSRIRTSVEVNGLLIPANSLGEYLHSFSEPALMHSENMEPYHLSKSGSLTKLKFRDRYFALVSHHQLRNGKYEYEQLCIFGVKPKMMVTSHRAIFQIEEEKVCNDLDCVIFEFSDVVNSGSLAKSGWYNLTNELFEESLPKPAVICTVGYPGHRNSIDYTTLNYSMGPNAIWGEQTQPKLTDRLAFKPLGKIEYDPVGMSGAPVFGVDLARFEPKLFFAGLLTNASRDLFHFISRTRLSLMLEEAML